MITGKARTVLYYTYGHMKLRVFAVESCGEDIKDWLEDTIAGTDVSEKS